MVYTFSWFAIALLLGLWSLTAWLLHGVAIWTVVNAGALSGVAAGAVTVSLPVWLAPWVPAELMQALAEALAWLAPIVDALLQAAPAVAGGLTVATWVIWGLGSALLLLAGAGLHGIIALVRRPAATMGTVGP